MNTILSTTQNIRKRKSVIDVNVNAKIKQLQRHLVELSFTKGSHTKEYFTTLGQIKALRLSEKS